MSKRHPPTVRVEFRCVECRKIHVTWRTDARGKPRQRCDACRLLYQRAYITRYVRERRWARKRRGQCETCGRTPRPGRAQCAACAQRNLANQARMRQRRRARGQCTHCWRRPLHGRRVCGEHLAYARAAADRKRGSRQRCPTCGHAIRKGQRLPKQGRSA